MKVLVHPADRGGCGYYRMIWPAKAAAAQGADVRVAYDATYRAIWQPSVFGDRIVGLADPPDVDVVVFQRPLARHRVELIDAFQAAGIAVVVEIDDDFHAIHPRNPAWRGSNPLADPDSNRDWLRRACDRADLVTVTTPALADRYGRHGRVAILPNYVPERYLVTEASTYTAQHLAPLAGPVIGWTGSVATHPDDLEETGGVLADVLAATGAHMHVIGTGVKVRDGLGLRVEPTATGWLPIEAYPEAIRQFDVGLVPLAGHAFNEAKSWLKGLEFAALGIPFVASPTGPYRALHEEGFGELAATPDDWRAELLRLLDNDARRERIGVCGRELAANFTIERNAWRWLHAWAQAAENRQRRRAA